MAHLAGLWTPPGRTAREVRRARLKLIGGALFWLAFAALVVAALGACGDQDSPTDTAVEATEQNTVSLGGVDYRVVRFRELNPRIPPDRSIAPAQPPRPGTNYYAAFVTACNRSSGMRTPTSLIHLEDAFGQRFAAVERDNAFGYAPRPLGPGECLPVPDSVTERALDGSALVFEVPLQAARKRPLILELERRPGGRGRAAARVQLDL